MSKLCWYCGKRQTDNAEIHHFHRVKGRKTVASSSHLDAGGFHQNRTDLVSYTTHKVEIPICAECKDAQDLMVWGWVPIALGIFFLLVMAGAVLAQTNNDGTLVMGWLIFFTVLLGILPIMAGVVFIWRVAGQVGMQHLFGRSHPGIKSAKRYDWKRGITPGSPISVIYTHEPARTETCRECKDKEGFFFCEHCGRAEWFLIAGLAIVGIVCILIAASALYNYHIGGSDDGYGVTFLCMIPATVLIGVAGRFVFQWSKFWKKPIAVIVFSGIMALVIALTGFVLLDTRNGTYFSHATVWKHVPQEGDEMYRYAKEFINYEAGNPSQVVVIWLRNGRLASPSTGVKGDLKIEIVDQDENVAYSDEASFEVDMDKAAYFFYIDDSMLPVENADTGAFIRYKVLIYLNGRQVNEDYEMRYGPGK